MKNDMNKKQTQILMVCALFAPLLQIVGEYSLLTIGVLFAIGMLLINIRKYSNKKKTDKTWLISIAAMLVLINYTQEAAKAWEYTPKSIAVMLLLMGLISAENIEKTSGVCIWGIALMSVIILFSGMKDIKLTMLNITSPEIPWKVIPIFMFLLCITDSEKGEMNKTWMILLGISVMAATWISGNITIQTSENILLDAGKSVSGLGSITRLDGLISSVLTIGWFVTISVLQKFVKERIKGYPLIAVETVISLLIIAGIKIAWKWAALLILFTIGINEIFGKRILDTKEDM